MLLATYMVQYTWVHDAIPFLSRLHLLCQSCIAQHLCKIIYIEEFLTRRNSIYVQVCDIKLLRELGNPSNIAGVRFGVLMVVGILEYSL
jgi:hypothetical protein